MGFALGLADFTFFLAKWRFKRLDDPAIIARCAEWGLGWCQAELWLNQPDGGAGLRAASRAAAERHGVTLVGAAYLPPETAWFERAVQAGHDLGVRLVRIACGPFFLLRPALPVPLLVERLRPAVALAERLGITLAIENHQDYTSDELCAIIAGVGSPHLGICLDTGNSIALCEDPLATARILAAHTRMVHLKDYAVLPRDGGGIDLLGVTLGQGVVDLPGVLAILRSSGRGDPLPVLIENPLECCSIDLTDPAYGQRLPHPDLDGIARLVVHSRQRHPDGVQLPQRSGLSDDAVIAAEWSSNRTALAYARTNLAL